MTRHLASISFVLLRRFSQSGVRA